MTKCIICESVGASESVEHIIPRTLGNIHYVLPKGIACQRCNNRFAKYEQRVLNSHEWFARRKKLGLISQKSEVETMDLQESDLLKFLVKIYFESLYASRRNVWEELNLEHLRSFLDQDTALTVEIYLGKTLNDGLPIPKWMDRWRLSRNRLSLRYLYSESVNYFAFSFVDSSAMLVAAQMGLIQHK